MIYGRKAVLEWFDKTPDTSVYISIYRKGKIESGNFVFSNKDRENVTKQDARAFLEGCLQNVGSGDFEVVANEKQQNTAKGRYEATFSISQSEASAAQPVQGIGAIPEGFVSKDEAKRIATEMFEQLQTKKENEDLKAKVAELTKENQEYEKKINKPWQEVITGLAPHLPGILQGIGFIPKPLAQVAGHHVNEPLENNAPGSETVEESNKTESVAKRQQIITDFVQTMAAAYPDTWEDILVKLTNAVTNDKSKIDMALKFL